MIFPSGKSMLDLCTIIGCDLLIYSSFSEHLNMYMIKYMNSLTLCYDVEIPKCTLLGCYTMFTVVAHI